MKKYIIIFIVITLGIISYFLISPFARKGKTDTTFNETGILPKVLFLTTGLGVGNGELSEGVVVAVQSFNKNGAFVSLETRNVLHQPDILSHYSIMVIPTSIGYHDGDKKYSLTFLSDNEMENIIKWVRNGGTLVAEENIGRNTIDDIDRAHIDGELNQSTWELSELFGITMKEIDLNGFSMQEKNVKIWNGEIRKPLTESEWSLVPSVITSESVNVMAEWTNGTESFPAIIRNDFGKGKAYLLTSTYLLHPSNNGGISSIEQIENFYKFVLENLPGNKKLKCELNPWPVGRSTAFCISFNSSGNPGQYRTLQNFLNTENLQATFFIDSSFSEEERSVISENKNITLQSDLFSKQDFSGAGYSEMARQFLLNEQKFGVPFKGVRFPYYSTNFWGLIFANDNGYIYDSSIGVDHLTSYNGSVFPYNIPVANNSYYKALKLIELCPVKNDDTHFFGNAANGDSYTDDLQQNDAQLFEKYLKDFFEYAVEKNNGLMIYQGNPHFTGFSENTLQPLKKITGMMRGKNCWMTSLDEVADFRIKLKDLTVNYSESGNKVKLKISLPEKMSVNGLSFRIISKPVKTSATCKYEIKESDGKVFLIVDVTANDEIELSF